MKIDGFLRILWQYPNLPKREQKKIDRYYKYAEKRVLNECNSFYMYATHMLAMACYQREPHQTIEAVQLLINQENYSKRLGEQLALELIDILFK